MDFGRISPTAFMTALARQVSGLPGASEMAERLTAHQLGSLPLLVEARHRAIDRLLHECKARQIVELASGFLTRGLTMTEDPLVTFVESDLPDVVALKQVLLRELAPDRPNLHVLAIDATAQPNPLLDVQPLMRVGEPIHVVCEGLLIYLDLAEKTRVCANVRELLTITGGSWITPDFASTSGLYNLPVLDREISERLERLTVATGRSLRDNAFAGLEEARQFVRGQGFEIEELPFKELEGELKCLGRLPLSPRKVDAILTSDSQRAFRLTVTRRLE